MAARLSLRTTDGESHETVHSALRHRGATASSDLKKSARVLAVIPCGLTPLLNAGADRSRSRCPSALAALAAKRAPAVKREWQSESSTAHRTRCGRAYNQYGLFCQGASLMDCGLCLRKFQSGDEASPFIRESKFLSPNFSTNLLYICNIANSISREQKISNSNFGASFGFTEQL